MSQLITGFVFAKFSHPASRMVFANFAVVSLFEGKPSLMMRVGHERSNRVVEATANVDVMQTRLTDDGVVFHTMTELNLARHRIAALTRSWNLVHVLDEKSPLFGASRKAPDAAEIELVVSLTGLDEMSGQIVHGQRQYEAAHVAWGHRHSDVLSAAENGDLIIDVKKSTPSS